MAVHARKDWTDSKLGEDEPVFHLRAKDKLAPQALYAWADLLEQAGGDKELAKSARRHANLMLLWQGKNGSKLPDAPPESLRTEEEYKALADQIAGIE